jgi:hypothetical protein
MPRVSFEEYLRIPMGVDLLRHNAGRSFRGYLNELDERYESSDQGIMVSDIAASIDARLARGGRGPINQACVDGGYLGLSIAEDYSEELYKKIPATDAASLAADCINDETQVYVASKMGDEGYKKAQTYHGFLNEYIPLVTANGEQGERMRQTFGFVIVAACEAYNQNKGTIHG